MNTAFCSKPLCGGQDPLFKLGVLGSSRGGPRILVSKWCKMTTCIYIYIFFISYLYTVYVPYQSIHCCHYLLSSLSLLWLQTHIPRLNSMNRAQFGGYSLDDWMLEVLVCIMSIWMYQQLTNKSQYSSCMSSVCTLLYLVTAHIYIYICIHLSCKGLSLPFCALGSE